MKKLKYIAPILMLFSSAVASIIMFRGEYDTNTMLVILLCVMLVFYGVGCLIQKYVISFVDQILEREKAEAEAAAAAEAARMEEEGGAMEQEIPAEESGAEA